MLVPAVELASTSASPANFPPVIDTVALVSVESSGSVTVTLPDSVVAPPSSVKDALSATPVSVGAWLLATMLIVSVRAVLWLNEAEPSLTTQVTVRVGNDPKSLGFPLVELNVRVEHLAVVRERVGAGERERLGHRVVARGDAGAGDIGGEHVAVAREG